ncbi:hypothetical protein B0H14DRAFT_2615394 [Mycena olivaceomarginata]|nr:hypothetical protein B0H14DRAFT_2615394 [Mycena olivaceomarginata]
MPWGRRPLNPDVKQQRREESLRRYNEKNAGKLREAARLRMQRHRATIATSNIFTQCKYSEKAALASERYRDRKREEERAERRAANAIIKRARIRCVGSILSHRKSNRWPPPLAQLPPPPTAKPPHAVSKRRALSPIIPTPMPCRPTVICMPAVAIVDSSDAESYDEPEHHPPELPIWPARTSRPQRCPHCYQEDCTPMNGLTILVVTISQAVHAKEKIVFALSAPFGRSMGVTKNAGTAARTRYFRALDIIPFPSMATPYPGILLCTAALQMELGKRKEEKWERSCFAV